ncbi:hypothetical protein RCL_jg1736.t1 [Rhizophagus clarus]|uniref:Uncharacterized protein n=1 Tax=Rhizophagus clarus TaxID=94130 RepID=A0A8H3QMB5_9GLOM|nr:hypothetical protein RCL_jg1736.t1 [Rhizophagus clarus]
MILGFLFAVSGRSWSNYNGEMIKKSKGKEYKLEFGLSLRDKVTLLLKQSLLHDERSKDIERKIKLITSCFIQRRVLL